MAETVGRLACSTCSSNFFCPRLSPLRASRTVSCSCPVADQSTSALTAHMAVMRSPSISVRVGFFFLPSTVAPSIAASHSSRSAAERASNTNVRPRP